MKIIFRILQVAIQEFPGQHALRHPCAFIADFHITHAFFFGDQKLFPRTHHVFRGKPEPAFDEKHYRGLKNGPEIQNPALARAVSQPQKFLEPVRDPYVTVGFDGFGAGLRGTGRFQRRGRGIQSWFSRPTHRRLVP